MADPDSTPIERDESTISVFMEAAFAEAPDRIPLLPTPGVYPHPSYGEVDLSPAVIDTLVANFQREVYPQNLPIDCEHSKDSGAAGWIKALHRNEDGSVDASVEWNAMGKQLLAEDRFRYISPSFRPEWTNPATRETHKNVLIGAGLTTRPYFKPGTLRPLIVASEPTTPHKEVSPMANEQKTPAETGTTDGTQITEQKFGEMLADRDKQIQAFAERITAVEAENASLKDAALERTFREQLAGLDNLDERVAELKALPAELREKSIARQQADAQRFAEIKKLTREIGSDALEGNQQSAYAEAQRKAAELREKNPKLTEAQAFAEVVKTEPGLYTRYQAEKQA